VLHPLFHPPPIRFSGASKVGSAKFPIQWTFCFCHAPWKGTTISYAGQKVLFVSVGLHKHYFWGHTKGWYTPSSILGYPWVIQLPIWCPARKDTPQSSSQLSTNGRPSSKLTAESFNITQWRQWDKGFSGFPKRYCGEFLIWQLLLVDLEPFLLAKLFMDSRWRSCVYKPL